MGNNWSLEEKQQFYRDHPELIFFSVAGAGYQELHPEVKEFLQPIDSVVTNTRDAGETITGVLKGLLDGAAWILQNPALAGLGALAIIVVVKKI